MCPAIDSLRPEPNQRHPAEINHSNKVKLVYMQESKTLSIQDLVDYSHQKGIHRHFLDVWVQNRPPTCNMMKLVFADNLEIVLWQHKDYALDRRRH